MGEHSLSVEYAVRIIGIVITNREEYFEQDCLNSDGRRAVEAAFKQLLRDRPDLRRIVDKVRRKPCYENLVKLYENLIQTNG